MMRSTVGYAKVINNRDLLRDRDSQAILNTNNSELEKYKHEREQRLKMREIIKNYDQLKGELNDIKAMLIELLGRNNK